MANKKPAKTPMDYLTKKEEVVGKPVMYIGLGERTFSCPTCGRTYNKGMMFEHNNSSYCSRRCISV